MTGKSITCRPCEIAGYLDEENGHRYHEAEAILALVRAWHDHCTGCDCEVSKRERGLLLRLRAFRRAVRDHLHVL